MGLVWVLQPCLSTFTESLFLFIFLQIQSHMFFLSVPMNHAGNEGSSCHLLTHQLSLNSNYCVKHDADKLLWIPSGPHKCSGRAVMSDMMSTDQSCSCPSSWVLSVQDGVVLVDWHHLWSLNSLRSRLQTGNSVHYRKNGVPDICFTAALVPPQPLCSLFNSLSLENS